MKKYSLFILYLLVVSVLSSVKIKAMVAPKKFLERLHEQKNEVKCRLKLAHEDMRAFFKAFLHSRSDTQGLQELHKKLKNKTKYDNCMRLVVNGYDPADPIFEELGTVPGYNDFVNLMIRDCSLHSSLFALNAKIAYYEDSSLQVVKDSV